MRSSDSWPGLQSDGVGRFRSMIGAAPLRPCQQSIERRAQRLAPFGETIFDLRRNLMMDNSSDDAVAFHLPELLDQHLL